MSPCLQTTPFADMDTVRVKRNHLNLQYPGTGTKFVLAIYAVELPRKS